MADRTRSVASTRPELPDPATMTFEELRAEVEGGRDAFEVVVVDLHRARDEVRRLRRELDHLYSDRAFLKAVLEAGDACAAMHAAIIAWLRGPVAKRVGREHSEWLASRCAAKDWRSSIG